MLTALNDKDGETIASIMADKPHNAGEIIDALRVLIRASFDRDELANLIKYQETK